MKKIPNYFLALLGGIGGCLAYWSAYKLEALSISQDSYAFYLIFTFTLWGIFFPISIWFYYEDKYWDYFLDKTIVYSFDKTGFRRHKSKFIENLFQKNIKGKKTLVTGGTSGIGRQVAEELSSMGSKVYVIGRNVRKGKLIEENNLSLIFHPLDLANWERLVEYCKKSVCYDYVVLNAGGIPKSLVLNNFNVEYQCASQLLGHYYLIYLLKKYGKINKHARIIWVSSGGMYIKKLDLDSLFINKAYKDVVTYANVKRAQITLVEELSIQDGWKNVKILSMHPGWVATPGLKDALPMFFSFMKNRLRDLKEGADTILWLLLTEENLKSGGFYFDREMVTPYLSNCYKPSRDQRILFLEKIENYKKEFFSTKGTI